MPLLPDPVKSFTLSTIRPGQSEALAFIRQAASEGFKDIVIEAPTGTGKSAIGTTLAYWVNTFEDFAPECAPGAYYACTQKMLQDQLETDTPKHVQGRRGLVSLKASIEYPCAKYKNCGAGTRTGRCQNVKNGSCTYFRQKAAFMSCTIGVTNYPFLFAEHVYVGKFPPRRVFVMDECHNLEQEIVRFSDVKLDVDTFTKWTSGTKPFPKAIANLAEFVNYLNNVYLPEIKLTYASFMSAAEFENDEMAINAATLDQHICKVNRAVKLITENPRGWVYWTSEDRKKRPEYIAQPLDAAPFFKELVPHLGDLRVYMSAYPGARKIFCRSLGLEPSKVAWLTLGSQFLPKKRPVVICPIGSMGRKSLESTLPSFLRMTEKIVSKRPEKGLIHCHSYKLGDAIFQHLSQTPHASRIIYPKSADEREEAFRRHSTSDESTIIITPSMTEGFDFNNDLARWQIIAKVPYPSLGDARVAAKKDQDPDWYALMAVKGIIQASGRIVRSESDFGATYITDADFGYLWEKYSTFFPRWWKEALIWK